jgi:hypothetical protein
MHRLSCLRRPLTAGVVLAAAAGLLPLAAPAAGAATPPPAYAADLPNLSTPQVAYLHGDLQSAKGVAARGADGALLYSARSGSGFAPFQSLGGAIVGDPSAVVTPNGTELFVRGTDDRVYANTVTPSGAATGYSVVPGLTVTGEIESVLPSDGPAGSVQIFARGTDGAVWTNIRRNGSWAGWTSLGGFITSDITAVRVLNIRAIFVRGSDNRVYVNNLHPAPSGFQVIDGLRVTSNIGTSEGSLVNGAQIFVRGEDNRVYTRFPASGGWQPMNGVSATSDITATFQAVYVRGSDNAIYTSRRDGTGITYLPFERVEGQVTGNPAAFTLQPSGGPLDDTCWPVNPTARWPSTSAPSAHPAAPSAATPRSPAAPSTKAQRPTRNTVPTPSPIGVGAAPASRPETA